MNETMESFKKISNHLLNGLQSGRMKLNMQQQRQQQRITCHTFFTKKEQKTKKQQRWKSSTPTLTTRRCRPSKFATSPEAKIDARLRPCVDVAASNPSTFPDTLPIASHLACLAVCRRWILGHCFALASAGLRTCKAGFKRDNPFPTPAPWISHSPSDIFKTDCFRCAYSSNKLLYVSNGKFSI